MADIAAGPGLVEQIRLVAWLRWRILRNSLRKKSRRLDLLGLVISGLVSAIFVAGVTVAFFVGTQSLLTNHHEQFLGLLFLALFIWWQLFPILFAGFTAQFAFRSLLRFPLKLSAFYFIGMAYGLADSAALAALVWMIAMVAAAAIALPAIAPVMLLACVMFAILNVTIERLLGAWVEKLLAKRRSREVFFSLFLLAMVGLQFLSPIIQKYGRGILTVVRAWLPYLWLLPSSFAGDAIARSAQHQWTAAALKLGGLCVYVGLFTVLLWKRYAQLYSGEELSETVAPERKEKRATIVASTDENETRSFLDPQILAILRKEILYFKRNTFLFFGLVFPPMLVLFFSMQFGGAHPTAFKNSVSPDLFFPGMMAYLVLMLIAPAYNNFAYEGKGIQTYFTSPVRFREILLAKNLVTVLLLFCEITFCMALVGWRAGLPSVPVLFATLAGAVFSVAGQLTIANWSSLNFPRRMEFGKMQGQRQSGMSVLIIFGVQILFGGVSALVLFSGRWTGSLWLPAQLFTALAVAALAGYFSSLDAFTELAEKKKEVLIDTLCR